MKVEILNTLGTSVLFKLTPDQSDSDGFMDFIQGCDKEFRRNNQHGLFTSGTGSQEQIDFLNQFLNDGPKDYRDVLSQLTTLPISTNNWNIVHCLNELADSAFGYESDSELSFYTSDGVYLVTTSDGQTPNIVMYPQHERIAGALFVLDDNGILLCPHYILKFGVPSEVERMYPSACHLLRPHVVETYHVDENATFASIYRDAESRGDLNKNFLCCFGKRSPYSPLGDSETPMYTLTVDDFVWINTNIDERMRGFLHEISYMSMPNVADIGEHFKITELSELDAVLSECSRLSEENLQTIIGFDSPEAFASSVFWLSDSPDQAAVLFPLFYRHLGALCERNYGVQRALGQAYKHGLYTDEEFQKDLPMLLKQVKSGVEESFENAMVLNEDDLLVILKYQIGFDDADDDGISRILEKLSL